MELFDDDTSFATLMIKNLSLDVLHKSADSEGGWSLDLERAYGQKWRVHIQFDQTVRLPEAPALSFHARWDDWIGDMLYVYLTPDEKFHGRVATATDAGESMDHEEAVSMDSRTTTFLMISDSRVTADRLSAIVQSWSMRSREPLVITQATMAYLISTWSPLASSPDMSRLFADAPAPVYASKTNKGLVAFAGGNVAVIDATNNESMHRLLYDGVFEDDDGDGYDANAVELLGRLVSDSGIHTDPTTSQAGARIFVSQSTFKKSPPENWMICHMDGVLHILLAGVPLFHVAVLSHTINEAIRKHHVDTEDHHCWCEKFDFLLFATTITQEHFAEEARAVARRRVAGETIARIMGPRVQARVWRPGGKLATRLATQHV